MYSETKSKKEGEGEEGSERAKGEDKPEGEGEGSPAPVEGTEDAPAQDTPGPAPPPDVVPQGLDEDGCSCSATPDTVTMDPAAVATVTGETMDTGVTDASAGSAEASGAMRDGEPPCQAAEGADATPATTTQPADAPSHHTGADHSRLDENATDANANHGQPSLSPLHSNTDSNQNKTTCATDIMECGGDERVILRERRDEGTEAVNVPGNKPGILHRISGSFGSITSGSFPSSPNFSSFVDFSSGLFATRDDPSSHSPTAKSAPTPARLSREGTPEPPNHSPRTLDPDMDFEIESAVKLADKPELFKSLDGTYYSSILLSQYYFRMYIYTTRRRITTKYLLEVQLIDLVRSRLCTHLSGF